MGRYFEVQSAKEHAESIRYQLMELEKMPGENGEERYLKDGFSTIEQGVKNSKNYFPGLLETARHFRDIYLREEADAQALRAALLKHHGCTCEKPFPDELPGVKMSSKFECANCGASVSLEGA